MAIEGSTEYRVINFACRPRSPVLMVISPDRLKRLSNPISLLLPPSLPPSLSLSFSLSFDVKSYVPDYEGLRAVEPSRTGWTAFSRRYIRLLGHSQRADVSAGLRSRFSSINRRWSDRRYDYCPIVTSARVDCHVRCLSAERSDSSRTIFTRSSFVRLLPRWEFDFCYGVWQMFVAIAKCLRHSPFLLHSVLRGNVRCWSELRFGRIWWNKPVASMLSRCNLIKKIRHECHRIINYSILTHYDYFIFLTF